MPQLQNAKPICPNCGELLDGFTPSSDPGSVPIVGDLSVCLYCVTPLEFTDGLNLKVLDINTLTIQQRNDLGRAIDAVRFARAMDRRRN